MRKSSRKKESLNNLLWLFTMTQEITTPLSKSFRHLIGCISHVVTHES